MKKISNLLLDEPTLQVMPTLATKVGLNESIVLQQIHYWLKIKEKSQQEYIDGHYWVYNTYKQWQEQFPFWSLNTIQRIFRSLEEKRLLISENYNKAGFDKTKWYTINYRVLNGIVTSPQNGVIDISKWGNGIPQNEVTNTREYNNTENTTENSFNILLQGATPERSTVVSKKFDWDILDKQIIGSCNRIGVTDPESYIEIIEYYYFVYMNTFNEEHPRLSKKAMDSVVEAIYFGTDLVNEIDIGVYHDMIDKHFQTQYENCDYSICHFMTEGIRNNRFFETSY